MNILGRHRSVKSLINPILEKDVLKATETLLVKFLEKSNQFFIPIYQRTYSWTEKQCEQLWDDIVRVAKDPTIKTHFIGSMVYINQGHFHVSDVPQLLVIDGQQRLTTMTILLSAFADALQKEGKDIGITGEQIRSRFLIDNEESGEKRYKLILTQSDKDTLINILEQRDTSSEKSSKNLEDNLKYFKKQINKNEIDLNALYEGICKLIIIDVALDSAYDNPQLIFESLNSTGLELSQADLIRNYVLMGLDREKQKEIYKHYWYPIEKNFAHSKGIKNLDRSKGIKNFDRFMRDYLTIKSRQIPKIDEVYSSFKDYCRDEPQSVEKLTSDICCYSKFFTKLISQKEQNPKLNQIICDIDTLKVDVAYPFLLEVYVDYDKGLITLDDIIEIFLMVESYVFRRTMCDIPTNTLNKTFVTLINGIEKDRYLESIKVAFNLDKKFPSDEEFKNSFVVKNVYRAQIKKYLFDKLENHNQKERVNINEYTIEHIMPQNKNLSEDWKIDLGSNWNEIREKYLHTIGNLTLTGYNAELGDKSFSEKRDMKGGFADSPIRLNHDIAGLEKWTEDEIVKRANTLSDKAIQIWTRPQLSEDILAKYVSVDDEDDEEDEDIDEDSTSLPRWDEKLKYSSDQVQQNIPSLITSIEEKFDCSHAQHSIWLGFYVKKPTEKKNLFAILSYTKTTAKISFRINPDTFNGDGDGVRKVVGWHFPKGTERRIFLTKESPPQILHLLEHSYDVTQSLIKKRHDAAVKSR